MTAPIDVPSPEAIAAAGERSHSRQEVHKVDCDQCAEFTEGDQS